MKIPKSKVSIRTLLVIIAMRAIGLGCLVMHRRSLAFRAYADECEYWYKQSLETSEMSKREVIFSRERGEKKEMLNGMPEISHGGRKLFDTTYSGSRSDNARAFPVMPSQRKPATDGHGRNTDQEGKKTIFPVRVPAVIFLGRLS